MGVNCSRTSVGNVTLLRHIDWFSRVLALSTAKTPSQKENGSLAYFVENIQCTFRVIRSPPFRVHDGGKRQRRAERTPKWRHPDNHKRDASNTTD